MTAIPNTTGHESDEWITLAQYCARTGDKPGAVHKRRSRQIWKDGVHCKKAPNNHLWVNYTEAQKWVKSNPPEP